MNKFVIIKNKDYPHIGRCVHCVARKYCGTSSKSKIKCECDMTQQYAINIKYVRNQKLLKIQKLNETM